jgi:hypothetical protein
MRKVLITIFFIFFASLAQAGVVTLNDGSSLSGELKEQANGDIVVVTGAGEITVAKDKIKSVIKDGSAAAPSGDFKYINEVLTRREKYGNEDGLPHTQNLQATQIAFTVGQLNYTGDGWIAKDLSGTTLVNASDLAGISFGLAWARSYTDYIALEVWGDYSFASKDYSYAGTPKSYRLQRYDVAIGPKVQKAIHLGGPEQAINLIPSIGLTPMWSGANGDNGLTTFNSSSVGASLNGGLDLQFGGALVGVKVRYLLSSDVTGSLKSSNTSAWLPQLSVGWAF